MGDSPRNVANSDICFDTTNHDGAAYFSKAIPNYLLKLSRISPIWLLEKFLSEP